MATPLAGVFSTIDSYKRRAAALAQGIMDDPVEALRQHVANLNNEAGENLDKLGSLYKDSQGNLTFDPSQWSPTAAANEADLSGQMTGAMMGATAWHGSPAKFAAFDPTKMGTGEGQQVYGKGLYLAQRPGIAQGYRKGLTRSQIVQDLNARYEDYDYTHGAYREFMLDPNVPKDQKRVAAALSKDDWLGFDNPAQAVYEASKNPDQYDLSLRSMNALRNAGSLYKVDLPDPLIPQMVDWDKPLFQQPDLMSTIESASNDPSQVALRKTLDLLGKDTDVRTGASLMNALPAQARQQSTSYAGQRAMVDVASGLQDAGIPGVKYLDALSRDSMAASPTSNYVVFPDFQSQLTLQSRNGVPMQPPPVDYNTWGGQ